jgi:hypothetical protein
MSVTNISEDLLKSYVASSNTWKEILQKCGYTNYGNNKYIKLLIDKPNFSIVILSKICIAIILCTLFFLNLK